MKKNQWYKITNDSENETAEIDIYGYIGDDFWGEGVTAKNFIKDLKKIKSDKIVVHINSHGGDVFDGNAIYNALLAHKAEIDIKIDGAAFSIASVIAMAGDNVYMPENTMLMVHDPSGFAMGTAEDMQKTAEALVKIKTGLISAYVRKTGLDAEDISDMMKEETWLTAQEAVDQGFADEILDPVKFQASFDKLNYKNVPKQFLNIKQPKTKKKETKIMNIEDLQKEHPELLKKFEADVRAECGGQAESEKKRITELVKAHFGDDSFAAVDAVIASGITVEQFKAVKGAMPVQSELIEQDKSQEAMLKAITDAGAELPGGNAPILPGKDFLAMVDEYQATFKTTKAQAMESVIKKEPEAHQKYIESVN